MQGSDFAARRAEAISEQGGGAGLGEWRDGMGWGGMVCDSRGG